MNHELYFPMIGGDSQAPWSVQLHFSSSVVVTAVSRKDPAPTDGSVTFSQGACKFMFL